MTLLLITSALAAVAETISSNCVPACLSCNQDKGSENWEEWMLAKFGFHPERKQLILNHINSNYGWQRFNAEEKSATP